MAITNRNGAGEYLTDAEFIDLWDRFKSATRMAEFLRKSGRFPKITPVAISNRRKKVEERNNLNLVANHPRTTRNSLYQPQTAARINLQLENGTILVGSDAHYWPGVVTTAHRAFVEIAKRLKPEVIVLNGDIFDGATVSRWPRGASVDIGWEKRPTVKDELEVVSDRLQEIFNASLNSQRIWTLGNHDARFELKLAAEVPEFENVPGFSLKERFPAWKPCFSVFVNNTLCIKHRWHNGLHATHNNVQKAGLSIVTGHLHALQMRHWSDYNGTRYGVDCGTLMDPFGPQAEGYMEDNPRQWRSGFAVLTFKDGRLMPPELCEVIEEGQVWFRGTVVKV